MTLTGVLRFAPTTTMESGTGAVPPTAAPPTCARHRRGAAAARLNKKRRVKRRITPSSRRVPGMPGAPCRGDVDFDLVTLCQISDEDLLRQRVLEVFLNCTLRAGGAQM